MSELRTRVLFLIYRVKGHSFRSVVLLHWLIDLDLRERVAVSAFVPSTHLTLSD